MLKVDFVIIKKNQNFRHRQNYKSSRVQCLLNSHLLTKSHTMKQTRADGST